MGTSGKGNVRNTARGSLVARIWDRGRRSTENFCGSETTLCDNILINACHYTFLQINIMYSISEPSCKLWTLGDFDVSMHVRQL